MAFDRQELKGLLTYLLTTSRYRRRLNIGRPSATKTVVTGRRRSVTCHRVASTTSCSIGLNAPRDIDQFLHAYH